MELAKINEIADKKLTEQARAIALAKQEAADQFAKYEADKKKRDEQEKKNKEADLKRKQDEETEKMRLASLKKAQIIER